MCSSKHQVVLRSRCLRWSGYETHAKYWKNNLQANQFRSSPQHFDPRCKEHVFSCQHATSWSLIICHPIRQQIVFVLISMCLFCTIACGVWETVTGKHFRIYLPWDRYDCYMINITCHVDVMFRC